MIKVFFSLVISLVLSGPILAQPTSAYFNQKLPTRTPELFAPDIVNTNSVELNAVFNADLTEFFFTRIINGSFVIHHSESKFGQWSVPRPIHMFPNNGDTTIAVDMTVTQDGKLMYFLGQQPGDPTIDIYMSEKVDGQWQKATKVPAPVSTDEYMEIYPVVVADGSLYFGSNRPGGVGAMDLYRAQYLGDGKFDTPVSTGPVINSEQGSGDAFVAADESFIIYNSKRPDSGLYVSFKKNNAWQEPIYLGEPINSEWTDFCPYMTPDHKFFFFSRRYSNPRNSGWDGVVAGEVYWVHAGAIFDLKPE